jgi:hypothetical protein
VTVLEGEVQFQWHDDGRIEVLTAPLVSRLPLELMASTDPLLVKVSGNRITLAGQVVYRVIGWDAYGQCLIAQLAEDNRMGVGSGG